MRLVTLPREPVCHSSAGDVVRSPDTRARWGLGVSEEGYEQEVDQE